jgi:hypothetical protein
MPLIINADYETAQGKIESERQLVELIQDVRTSISELDLHFEDKPYAEVLRVIEKERSYDIRDGGLSNHSLVRINLSQAASLIHIYREGSEGGCRACIGLGCERPLPGDVLFWCSKFEKFDGEGEADLNCRSPRLKKYWDKGCEAREPRFKRTVEEVLAVAEEHGLAALMEQK